MERIFVKVEWCRSTEGASEWKPITYIPYFIVCCAIRFDNINDSYIHLQNNFSVLLLCGPNTRP